MEERTSSSPGLEGPAASVPHFLAREEMQTKGDMEAARRFSPIPFVHRVRRDADGSEDCGSGGVALNFLRLLAGCGSVFLSTGFVGRTIQTRRNFALGHIGHESYFCGAGMWVYLPAPPAT